MADITLLATADWDHPLWTNKQHVACSLAELGHRVLYVESLGLRPPRQGARGPGAVQARSDRGRIWRRLRHGLQPPRRVRPGLWVWSPLVLPGAQGGLALRVNRLMLGLGLGLWRRVLGLRADWLWTYNPMTLAVLEPRPWRRLIYHCVDAIQAQPGMPAAVIERWEQRLCRRADAVFVTSPDLQRRLAPLNPLTRFYPNVADGDHFARAMDPALPLPADLAAIPAPRLGFVGAISAYKLDLALLEQLARAHPGWSLVLIGPVGEGDPTTDVAALAALANVHLLGPRPYAELPAYLKGFDLGLLPLRFNAYTQAMFPMKFFEYLAAGLPVVSSAIDALQPFADLALLVDPTPEAFTAAITAVLAGEGPSRQQRLAGAAAHTYRGRTEAMLRALAALG
ncbi:glycosyltransferase [Vulcanococcus limneticus]|uniref:glycosyltransferase n=1 Tax=Vulcanococcus limneticus TaxID=2170428 RepID=UPI00398BF1BA